MSITTTTTTLRRTAMNWAPAIIMSMPAMRRKPTSTNMPTGAATAIPTTTIMTMSMTCNLTWNLEHPETAYKSWIRVLKKGGLLLNFDANWYRYLFDGKKREEYEADRRKVAENAMEDYNVGENFDVMERIALKMPLSSMDRPEWDTYLLKRYGMEHVLAERNIGDILYSEKEKINYGSTPMFCIQAVKGR